MCECKHNRMHALVEGVTKTKWDSHSSLLRLDVFWGWSGFLFTALMVIFTLPSIFIIYLLDIVQPIGDEALFY